MAPMLALVNKAHPRRRRGYNKLKPHARSVRKFHRRMIALLRSHGFIGKELEEETLRMRTVGTPYSPPDAPRSALRASATSGASGPSAHHAHRSSEPEKDETPVSSFRTRKVQHQLASKAARDAKRSSRRQSQGDLPIN